MLGPENSRTRKIPAFSQNQRFKYMDRTFDVLQYFQVLLYKYKNIPTSHSLLSLTMQGQGISCWDMCLQMSGKVTTVFRSIFALITLKRSLLSVLSLVL